MTPERLAHLRALLAGVTPGPWAVHRCSFVSIHHPDGAYACGIDTLALRYGDGHPLPVVADTNREECDHMLTAADAALLAEAPTAIAELLAEVERLRTKVERMAAATFALHRIVQEDSLSAKACRELAEEALNEVDGI